MGLGRVGNRRVMGGIGTKKVTIGTGVTKGIPTPQIKMTIGSKGTISPKAIAEARAARDMLLAAQKKAKN
ncbi:MAG: hypothetical protein WCW13_01415 [archaeon]|jgi:hypothetical protein